MQQNAENANYVGKIWDKCILLRHTISGIQDVIFENEDKCCINANKEDLESFINELDSCISNARNLNNKFNQLNK